MTPLYHANNRERLRKIHKTIIARELRIGKQDERSSAGAAIDSFPALLAFAGFPLHHNQRCCFHQSSPDGTSLSFFVSEKGHWMFKCNSAHCGIRGDVTDFWLLLVEKLGLPHRHWSRHQAAADLLTRVESGEIDVSITDFDGESAKAHGHGRRRNGDAFSAGDGYWEKLGYLIKQNRDREIAGSMRLPRPLGIGVNDVIRGLFPDNGFLMLSARKQAQHLIGERDEWLAYPEIIEQCSHVSQNYCSRCDVDGTSYDAFVGIERRWMVIEADRGTLEQQFWLHQQFAAEADLGCLCWSGGKSLHGWYFVEGWTIEQCFALYAKAIRLGVNDCHHWLICQQARLPAGFNSVTGEKQSALIWNL